MKKIHKIFIYFSFIGLLFCLVISCDREQTDFGFDGSIYGTVKDAAGNIVHGDVTSANLVVYAQGESDRVATEIRVLGDGTFANNVLYPEEYEVWISGPIVSKSPVIIDLTGGQKIEKDFIVVPYLTIDKPVVSGSTATSVTINYSITGNEGYEASHRELFTSTSSYPSPQTGSGPYYETIRTNIDDNEGSVTVEGLTPNTRYFIRIGARVDGEGWNWSDQIIINSSN